MKICFEGNIDSLLEGIKIIGDWLGFEISNEGTHVKVEQRKGNIEVSCENGKGLIRYCEKIHFFRALGVFCEEILENKKDFYIEEEPQFEMNGIIADVSRNAVLTVYSIKNLLSKMAVMGMNIMMLYAEDTYTVSGRPYFGYMRGKYTYRELKECDDYADILGIEIIPCIQTLAHLEQAIKWDYANEIKDTPDILLVGNEKTYQFIDELIKAASSPFRSKRIHLCMDEAHNLGLGRYLDINGFQRRFDIMSQHLAKVKEITDKYGLEPMMWSDMFFRLGSKTGDYYDVDAVIPEDAVEKIPESLGLIYWDYYHNNEGDYLNFIRKHKDLKREIIFAGGIWTWTGFTVDYDKTFVTTNAALKACKTEGIKKVFATLWGDNGAETNIFSALLGLQLFAEHGYARDVKLDRVKSRFQFCTKGKQESFMDISKLNYIPGTGSDIANPSKYLLWQDVLMGMFDKNVEGIDLKTYYSELGMKLGKHLEDNKEWEYVFEVPYKLCSVLSLKSNIGVEIKKLYDSKDIDGLKKMVNEKLSDLYALVDDLRITHRNQWFKTNKPFGWEVIDIRYGGLLARINTASKRLEDFLEGRIERIDELEEERLYFGSFGLGDDKALGCFNNYQRIVSACPM